MDFDDEGLASWDKAKRSLAKDGSGKRELVMDWAWIWRIWESFRAFLSK